MKQSEKSKITFEKILMASIEEFGTKGYNGASVNNICINNGISKGLVYHNFKNKDDLYLRCVESCFSVFTDFLRREEAFPDNFNGRMNKLIALRYQFFRENPYYSYIFFSTVLQPPKHLTKQIKLLRQKFDEFNIDQYRLALETVSLREGITRDEAVEYFFVFQEMFNGYFQNKISEKSDFNSLIEAHELKLSKILNIMLYGIAKNEACEVEK